MAPSRRFYTLLVLSTFAACSINFFLDINSFRSALAVSWNLALSTDAGKPTAQTKTLYDELSDETKGIRPDEVPTTQVTKLPGYDDKGMLGFRISTKTSHADTTSSVQSKPQIKKAKLRIGIIEAVGTHDEVTAALVYTFGKVKNVEISTYLRRQRYGMATIINSFNLTNPIARSLSTSKFKPASKRFDTPQILVSTTCEMDIVLLAEAFDMLLARQTTFLFCVIHHADHWAEGESAEKIQPWVQKGLVRFLGLSASTADYLEREAVPKWPQSATVPVNFLPPVFPVSVAESPAGQRPLTFALQGHLSSERRNYTSIFSRLEEVVRLAKNRRHRHNSRKYQDVQLHLVGGGTAPTIPDGLESYISIDKSLDYIPFYTLLSQTFTLLTSFASPEYLDRKASSSVPASLIAGTPIVATAEILDAYSYLPADAVWLQDSHESEMDVVERVIQLSDKEHARKKAVVRRVCEELMQTNIEIVEVWVEKALAEIAAASGRM